VSDIWDHIINLDPRADFAPDGTPFRVVKVITDLDSTGPENIRTITDCEADFIRNHKVVKIEIETVAP
jgi:hypothetical protein